MMQRRLITGFVVLFLAHIPVGLAETCSPLSLQVNYSGSDRTAPTRMYLTQIAPGQGVKTHTNAFFLINSLSEEQINSVIVKLTPLTTDIGLYPTQLVARYSDDSIFESGAPIFTPDSTKPIIWGPLVVNQPGKLLTAFNVKILENFRLIPESKGFKFKVEVLGCR